MSYKTAKITERQMFVLNGVPRRAKPSYVIAQNLRQETHWIASQIKALEKKGLIVCTRRGGPGRASLWELTPSGIIALSGGQP